jgi:integrase
MLPKERRVLTHDEARALESALAGAPDEAMWLSMLLLGLRPGEATGLTWADVDLDEGVLHMAGDRKWTPKGYVLGPPKTRRGNRALKMPPRLVAAFAQLTPGGPDDLVFPTRTGSLRDPSNDRHRLARYALRATPHGGVAALRCGRPHRGPCRPARPHQHADAGVRLPPPGAKGGGPGSVVKAAGALCRSTWGSRGYPGRRARPAPTA